MQATVHAVRTAREHRRRRICWTSRSPRPSSSPWTRRPTGRPARAASSPRWAPCSWAAASCTSASRRSSASGAAGAGDPALHRHHAEHGRRSPARRGFPHRAEPPAGRTRPRGAQRRVRQAGATPGVRPRELPGRSRRSCAPSRWPGASRRCRSGAAWGAGRRARHRGRWRPPRARGRGDLRRGAVRVVLSPVRRGRNGGRGAGAPAPRAAPAPAPGADDGRRRDEASAPDLAALPDAPGVYLFRNSAGQALYVGKSVVVRRRARSHRPPPLGGLGGRRAPSTRLRGDGFGAGRPDPRAPAHPRAAPAWERAPRARRRYVYLRCRLDIAYPVLEIAPEPAAGVRSDDRPASRACGGGGAQGAARLAVRVAPLRAQAAPAALAVRLRPDGPLPVALPQRPRSEPLPAPAGRRAGALRGRR